MYREKQYVAVQGIPLLRLCYSHLRIDTLDPVFKNPEDFMSKRLDNFSFVFSIINADKEQQTTIINNEF